MKVADVVNVLERFAPPSLQQGYDNSGLVVGRPSARITAALVCVDVTDEVMDEAVATGAGMIVSHHPLIFHPLKRLNGEGYVQRLTERAIREGVALYACHTNLDAVYGGLSHRLAARLGLEDVTVLDRFAGGDDDAPAGFGVTGTLPAPMPPAAFLQNLKGQLRLEVIRHSALCRDTVRRVSLCTGAGASLIPKAIEAGSDIYIAADFKYNDFMEADGKTIVADIGHFESEYCSIDLLYDVITKNLPNFAVRKSANSRNPVKYYK